MTDPIIIVCDDNGKPTGEYVPKEVGHTGTGKHHLAITVLLYNKQGQILLQERKHIRFDRLWDLTGATDVYHRPDGTDETFEEATQRCLKREYNITGVKLRQIGEFNYFAPDGKFCENEHCALLIGEYNGEFEVNPEVAYSTKWVEKQEFLNDVNANPDNYSPWALASASFLQQNPLV